MTDAERQRITAICEAANIKDISDLSDGYHTFRQLYYQRMMLFAALVKQNRDKAWKSLRHEDGELCFGGGWFIVGIDTPEGSYTYHYEDKYFSLFDCEELERGKPWDGHTEKDVTRLLSLEQGSCENCINKELLLKHLESITMDTNPDHYECEDAWYQANGFNLCKITIEMYVKNLPSAIPQSNVGHWIKYGSPRLGEQHYKCTVCGYYINFSHWGELYTKEFKYCPNCGSKMLGEEPQESEK